MLLSATNRQRRQADRQTDNQLIGSLWASHVGAKADILSATDAASGDTQSFGCSFSSKSDGLNCFEFGEETMKPEDISTTKAAESHKSLNNRALKRT